MKRLVIVYLLVIPLTFAQQSDSDHHWLRIAHQGSSFTTEEFVAKEEGLRLRPYYDAAGFPTVGVGHKLSDERNAPLSNWKAITHAQALKLLQTDLAGFRAGVAEAMSIELTPNQETALISLAYNIGLGAFSMSDLVRFINGGAAEHIVTLEWTDWNKAHVDGRLQLVDGLLERRRREVAFYFGDPPTP